MAEMGSALPTSGGLYWWTFKFAPEALKKPLCFLAGYSNTLGLVGGVVSIDYGFASMVLSVPSIADPHFTPNKYQTYGVFVACVLSHMVIGSVATTVMSRLQTFCIVINMLVIVITVIAVPIGAKNLRSGHEVFTDTTNLNDWPYGWTWMLSWMSAIWTIGAFDSCVHLSEEATNAATAVPFGIVLSISMCGVLGFAILAVLISSISDFSAVINTATGQPMAQIYLDALGKKWTIAMMIMLFIVQWFMGLSLLVAASRQTWAFSRDGALPLSWWVRKINMKLQVPVRAVIFDGVLCLVIGLLVLVDTAAALALFSLAPASNGLAWLLPIFCRHVWFDKDAFKPGPFYLGHFFSRLNGLFASVYLIFVVFVLSMWPASGPDPTPQDMNYTCVINGAVWVGSLLYYFLSARKWFEGPQQTLDTEEIHGVDLIATHSQHHHGEGHEHQHQHEQPQEVFEHAEKTPF
ncbi:Uga4p [Sugiyamaella lignohabitans]|uniref:Uga4p n=1 Tax=Sugiyamaella lignohabitans TaxID=796027 RepID=A0A167EY90_9ASCO|nr:Uga4p [Sugiyamaella lignohabitans]ANB14602.1 Uga4p [Sugiyamaella lignohabitans]